MSAHRALIIAAVTLSTASAHAYSAVTLTNGNETKWTEASVPWFIDPDGSDDLTLGQVDAALSAAFASWDAAACNALSWVKSGTAESTANGTVRVTWEENTWDPAASNVLAITTNTFNSFTGKSGQSTIEFTGVNHTWSTTLGEAGTEDVQDTATHEIGHALGLRHTRERDASLFFQAPPTTPRAR